jgi:tryptophan synthase alpha chain
MNRIKDLFSRKTNNILSVYCTAGYPLLDSTKKILKALEENGADMIELGMPYSDPLADGPVIQASGSIAIENGMTIKVLFEQLKGMRDSVLKNTPVILMGYINPIIQFGFEKFCSEASAVGIDGLILPDLPEYEYETQYSQIIKKHQLDFIFLVTPETSEERIKKLDELSSGFLYAVSSSSTTGKDKNMEDVTRYLQRLKALKLKNPVLVGFGIKNKETFQLACAQANGAIIGTAYIKALEKAEDVNKETKKFLDNILQ